MIADFIVAPILPLKFKFIYPLVIYDRLCFIFV
jgi:hypothetical protein